jgi:hypothetical protein
MKRVIVIFLSLVLFRVLPSAAQSQAAPPAQQLPTAQATQTDFVSKKGFVLEDETPVRLRLNRTISSADAHVGDTLDFETLDDITVNGTLVIPKGGLAFATVTEAQAKSERGQGCPASRERPEGRRAYRSDGRRDGSDEHRVLPGCTFLSFYARQRHKYSERGRDYCLRQWGCEARYRKVPAGGAYERRCRK